MKIDVLPASCMSPDLVTQWRMLRQQQPSLASPHLAPEFVQAVAEARGGVEVIVVSDNHGLAAIVPFYRHGHSVAQPLAGSFSDLEGCVIRPDFTLELPPIMRAAGLRQWQFRRWLAHQTAFSRYAAWVYKNPVVDLTEGWDSYCSNRRSSGTAIISSMEKKKRKFVREVGPLQFEFNTSDPAVLHQLLYWKSLWAKERGLYNPIGAEWHLPLLENLLGYHSGTFVAQLSGLYLGNRLIAGMFCLRDGDTGALWLSSFDPQLSRYSPGLLWFNEFLRNAPQHGLRRVEMGEGDERHKGQLANDAVAVAEGVACRWPLAAAFQRRWLQAKRWLRQSPRARPIYQWAQRTRAWWDGA